MSEKLRTAAQAALEALENSVPADRIPLVKFYDAIDALSAALARPNARLTGAQRPQGKDDER